MKIALIRREYITHIDGVNRFIAMLAEGLAKLGHCVEIFSWCYREIGKDLEEWFKEIHGLDTRIPIHTLVGRPCRGDPWIIMAFDWYLKGSEILHKENFDTVIVNGVVPLRFKPKIAVNHGITLKPNRLYLSIIKRLYRGYDKVICVSHRLRGEIRDILDVDCEVIPLPMKLELYKPKSFEERENIIVHIGTRPVKNPQISVEAFKILRKKGYKVKLVIIGSSTTRTSIEGVEYKYNIPEKEKIDLLCRARVTILPSRYEALPYTVLEAMACGTPVVVSRAIPEELVIDNYNGIKINNFDPEHYAKAIENLLKNEEHWLKLSRNELEFVKQFNYIEIARRYSNIVNEFIRNF